LLKAPEARENQPKNKIKIINFKREKYLDSNKEKIIVGRSVKRRKTKKI